MAIGDFVLDYLHCFINVLVGFDNVYSHCVFTVLSSIVLLK